MKFHSLFTWRRHRKFGALVFLGVGGALACGPDFPNSYLDLSARAILSAPEGYFAVEIARLMPEAKRREVRDESEPDAREEGDLRQALSQRGESEKDADKLLDAYRTYRAQQRRWAEDKMVEKPGTPPEGLPREFVHYLAGANAWYAGEVDLAREEWQALLALPAAERQFRSTWAAYMLGKSVADVFPPGEAQRWWLETRELARAGFADSINLLGASYGLEAYGAMALQDYGRAICLYLDQHATSDESAFMSLRMAAAAAAGSDIQQKREIAREPRARRVLTAWYLARFGSSFEVEPDPSCLRDWTSALVIEQIRDIDYADRCAWLAYEAGDFELAKTWAGMAKDSSPETHWIRGKLALLDNRLGDAAQELHVAAASRELAPIYRSTVLGELGRVHLALDRPEDALAAWLEGEHWEDAAYVAERLLTIDELRLFYANYRATGQPVYEPYEGEAITLETLVENESARAGRDGERGPSLRLQLGELLARRLVRAGRADEAGDYFCAANQVMLAAYLTDVKAGFNPQLSARKRAMAFWRAAQLAHREGMALMGAELEPDFSIWGGSFGGYGVAEQRLKREAGRFSATSEEIERIAKNPAPANRFSYRYRAADLAWWAASLLPNDDEETARILNTAGGWLKSRDPSAANRFYQALVIRCGRTKLGKAASERRWFPFES